MTSDQSWKEKYLQELESADQREEQWKAERNTLERMLVRTCLASEGQAPELDRLLARVRKDLRKNKVDVENWRELQEQIDRQVTLLDEKPVAKKSLFNWKKLPEQEADSPPAETPPDTVKPTDSGSLDDNTQRLRIARRVGQLLGQLLSQVSLEANAEAQARVLQQSLLSSDSWDELREGLNHVADLVIAAIARSQREFEAFLQRLDERLEVFQQHFANQSSAQAERIRATELLDQEIRHGLECAGVDVQESHDLGELKSSVSDHLESIAVALDRFRAQETQREQELADQLAAMQEKMAAMEAHSEQMQEQIRRERQKATTDLLTQLPNREAWQERLSFEYNRWKRYQHPLTVGVLDIDLFKRINDSYGHKAGDRVLQLVARELKERLRNTDFIARYGGEEFVLLFPETSPVDAIAVLDQLRAHVANLPFHFSGEPVTVTFSAGVSGFSPGDTGETVFDRADRALYQAKDAGRNQVHLEPDSPAQ
ncbi:diguanylate cyclase [Marinobacter salinexigens]|uniref:diguanylate cyclase n=1 Tax=Marinobacter salinexigens TaxID=2919747 RepID=A0A5B0VD55_9GAMM|nr:GGDEF domain-containing protein [Marinobacter salinexigens]KAA1172394.1 diguanylate cyclase [Marinobacter salinexigens]